MENFFLKKVETTTAICQMGANELAYCSSSAARKKIKYDEACKLEVLPLSLSLNYGQEMITFACPKNPTLDLEKTLKFITGLDVQLVEIGDESLKPAIYAAYKADDQALEVLKYELKESAKFVKKNIRTNSFRKISENNNELKFLIGLIDYAIAKMATDIHLVPNRDGFSVKIRVNGELLLHPESAGSSEQYLKIINRLKILSQLDLSIKQCPQDGAFNVDVIDQEIRVRLSLMPTVYGEKAVLRIQGNGRVYNLDELGLTEYARSTLENAISRNEGLIIFCGPTGSGKTTTMYSALSKLSSRNLSIITIEDPVEAQLNNIEQTAINPETGLTYIKALKSALRQDPDVILFGEIRDSESAQLVIQASLTGHLIMTTLHAGDVFQCLTRLKQLGISSDLLLQSLVLVVNQRLVPLLCEHCKTIDLKATNIFQLEIQQAVGCVKCYGSGYLKQKILSEMLGFNQELAESLVKEEFYTAKKLPPDYKNYLSFKDQLQMLLKEGKIDLKTFKEYS